MACEKNEDDFVATINEKDSSLTDFLSDHIRNHESLDSLEIALDLSGMMSTFQSPGTYTLFAPNNEAFVNMMAGDSTINQIADIDLIKLSNIIKYHSLPNHKNSFDINLNSYFPTLNSIGSSNEANIIEFDKPMPTKIILNNGAEMVEIDMFALNGILHIIDSIIEPQNMFQMCENDERYSSMLEAINIFGDTISDLLKESGDHTLFAPSNDAFQDLLNSNSSWNSIADINRDTLKVLLSYHLTDTRNIQTRQMTQDQKIISIAGDTITVDLSRGFQLITQDTSQNKVNIEAMDIQGINGVIQSVDKVMKP